MTSAAAAIRATLRGRVQGVGFRDATVRRAHELRVHGWVRNGEDQDVLVHAEGGEEAVEALVAFLREGPATARVEDVAVERVKVEGHEQFAVRGVAAGAFAVWERERGFELRLEVEGTIRAWLLTKEPSLDPAAKRFAIQLAAGSPAPGPADARPWDGGPYEQGGRVPWPEAIERGHAVFVLHGERPRGGFALQRTRGTGERAGWLLVKRRDEHAQPRATGGT
jgi:acylphosphatase